MKPIINEPSYRNGVYPHESFARRHRLVLASNVASVTTLLLLCALSSAVMLVLLLGVLNVAWWLWRQLFG